MKRRFWTRLISAVLTMAMAFSILAVPASAASEGNSWAIGTANGVDGYMWTTKSGMRRRMGEGTDDETLEKYKADYLAGGDLVEYPDPDDIPEDAFLGIELDGTLYWYGEDAASVITDGTYSPSDIVDGVIMLDGADPLKPIASNSVPKRLQIALGDPMEWCNERYNLDIFGWGVVSVIGVRGQFVSIREDIDKIDEGDSAPEWLKNLQEMMDIEILKEKTAEEICAMSEAEVVAFLKDLGYPFVELPIDTVYCGISQDVNGEIYWYTAEQWDEIEKELYSAEEDTEIKWEKGVFTIGEEVFEPMEIAAAPAGSDSSSKSSIGAGAAIAVVAGAAVAATGVYLYTHPEKVEEIKDFFADLSGNVQAKVQQLTANVKGAFGIVIPDSEDEEEEPVAAAVEEAQAA